MIEVSHQSDNRIILKILSHDIPEKVISSEVTELEPMVKDICLRGCI